MFSLWGRVKQDLSSGRSLTATSAKVLSVLVCGALLQLLFHVLLARVLKIELYGVYAIGFSVYTLALLLVKLSGDTVILRELPLTASAHEEKRLITGLAATSGLLFVLLLIGYLVIEALGPTFGRYSQTVLLFLLVLPIGVLLRLAAAVARVRGSAVVSQVGEQLVRPAVSIPVLLALSISVLGTGAAVASFAIGVLAALSFTVYFAPRARYDNMGLSTDCSNRGGTPRFKSAVIMTAISGQNVLIKQIDVLLLGALTASAVVGGYVAATKIAVLAAFMLSAVTTVIAPRISQLYSDGRRADLQELLTRSSRLIASFSAFVWVMVVVGAGPLLGLFGVEFQEASSALRILVSAQLISSLLGPVGTFMNMTNQEHISVRVFGISLAVCVGLNLTLIPRFQQNGAAIAYFVSIVLCHVSLAWYVKKRMGLNTTVFRA